MKTKFSLKFLFLFFLWIPFAAGEDLHNAEHQQIFHAFTLEVDGGEARSGKVKAYDFSGWVGGDYNRIWINSEKKDYGDYEKKWQGQIFYSRNFSQFWDAQIGLAHDFKAEFSSNKNSYLVIGIEGLAPYFFETTAQIFLSDDGDWSAELKEEIDILLTQKLIAQPYFEAEFFAQDVKKSEVKSGLSNIEIGAITRYEFSRKFAPYFALRYCSKVFGTADLAKENGEEKDEFIGAIGIRFRF